MSEITAALLVFLTNVLTFAGSQYWNRRKVPSEIQKALADAALLDAQAEKQRLENYNRAIEALYSRDQQIADLNARLASLEAKHKTLGQELMEERLLRIQAEKERDLANEEKAKLLQRIENLEERIRQLERILEEKDKEKEKTSEYPA